jgi:hypothetical protein
MIYILSCVVHKFFFLAGGVTVHHHLDFTFFSPDDHALVPHAAHHIKWIPGLAPKSQLQGVFLDAFCKGGFQRMLDFKEPVGRTQTANALVGAFVIVIFQPEGHTPDGIFKAGELGSLEELALDGLPKAFDFP